MDDVVKFLLIAGFLLIGIVKQFKKEANKDAESTPPVPMPEDINEDSMPIPAGWDDTYGGYIPQGPKPQPRAKTKDTTTKEYQFSSSKHVFSGESPKSYYQNTTSPPKQQASPPKQQASPPNSDIDSEYAINSAEEARKAIIWSEVLQRKYC